MASPQLPLADGDVGTLLRDWRLRRRHSQLSLALDAGVSARHLSFVETGRARPSRDMVLKLAERLDVPPRERDALLLAAGYAPAQRARSLDDAELRSVRAAVDTLLAAFAPNPALAVDRHWNIVAHNAGVALLLRDVDPSLLAPPANALRVSLHPKGLAPRIENLPAWRAHVLERLRRDAELTADPALADLLGELRGYPAYGVSRAGEAGAEDPLPVIVPLRLRTPAGVLAFVSTTTVFGTAVDATAAELAIETFLPADAATAEALRALSGST
ncbi:helix-turn-helix transcriptional regulator [Roseisolibacter sp. H3M3-2]|uniref:helix-turn-helix transcriptional regulator n=1 Tax=Roseisolibacter sp. H3M3-2 TaxID=3031323 RepID=UPI0023DAB341|nr:helix-turn-helix transcriptional regulator [Roseisolibacter sp. H3M3-2]MDF1505618.1 helix-turn-helix transcriptional regulator [Roseisolibacter sp. H3M3-2]